MWPCKKPACWIGLPSMLPLPSTTKTSSRWAAAADLARSGSLQWVESSTSDGEWIEWWGRGALCSGRKVHLATGGRLGGDRSLGGNICNPMRKNAAGPPPPLHLGTKVARPTSFFLPPGLSHSWMRSWPLFPPSARGGSSTSRVRSRDGSLTAPHEAGRRYNEPSTKLGMGDRQSSK